VEPIEALAVYRMRTNLTTPIGSNRQADPQYRSSIWYVTESDYPTFDSFPLADENHLPLPRNL